jgi:hypothetical protein
MGGKGGCVAEIVPHCCSASLPCPDLPPSFLPPSPNTGIDFSKTGVQDIVVGRDDGLVEMYNLDENGQPQQVSAPLAWPAWALEMKEMGW